MHIVYIFLTPSIITNLVLFSNKFLQYQFQRITNGKYLILPGVRNNCGQQSVSINSDRSLIAQIAVSKLAKDKFENSLSITVNPPQLITTSWTQLLSNKCRFISSCSLLCYQDKILAKNLPLRQGTDSSRNKHSY